MSLCADGVHQLEMSIADIQHSAANDLHCVTAVRGMHYLYLQSTHCRAAKLQKLANADHKYYYLEGSLLVFGFEAAVAQGKPALWEEGV